MKKIKLVSIIIFFNTIICLSQNHNQNGTSIKVDSSMVKSKADFCGYNASNFSNPNTRIANNGSMSPLAMPKSSYPANAIFDCGAFRLYYEDIALGTGDGFADATDGPNRRATLCAVYQYIQNTFNFSNIPASDPITIEIERSFTATNPPVNAGVLATARPIYPNSTTPGIYNGSLLNHVLTNASPNINLFDAALHVNFAPIHPTTGTIIVYHNLATLPVPNCEFDLYTILLHEVGHQLGFGSLLRENGSQQPVSGFGNNQYTLFDWQNIWHGNINTPSSFEKIVTGTTASPQINPLIANSTRYLSDEGLWLNDNGRFLGNLPIYSGVFGNWPYLTIGSVASHICGDRLSFTERFSLSPGYMKPFSMSPSMDYGETRREYTDEEIRIFLNLGYTLHPIYATSTSINGIDINSNIITSNRAPITTKQTTSPTFNTFPDFAMPADFTIYNDGSSLLINLSADATLRDADGDQISIENNTLFNIRGCGNGGNNHNCLTINATRDVISFTPRPNFIGRAQFGFYLHDGKERGSFMVYTIDVNPGSSFINTPNNNTPTGNNELIVNGDFEEATETKTTINEFLFNTSDQLGREEGLFFGGVQFADSHPLQYINWSWTSSGGIIMGNTLKDCSQGVTPTRFGHEPTSFPSPLWNNPIPVNGNNYSYIIGQHNYHTLERPLVTCRRYITTFDVNFLNTGLAVGSIYTFNLNVHSAIAYPTNPSLQNIPVSIVVGTGWQTITVPFVYCSATPGNFLNFVGDGKINYDNVSLILDSTPIPPLTITASSNFSTVCPNSFVVLSSVASSTLCNTTYVWQPGNLSGSTVTVTPSSSTIYTVTVDDGCRTASTTVNINVVGTSSANVSASIYSICTGQSSTLTATGVLTSTWQPINGNSSTIIVSPSVTTTYTYSGNTPSGCLYTIPVTINVLAQPTLNVVCSNTLICAGTSITLTATGANTYTILPSNVNTSISVLSPSISTTYTVIGGNAPGCTDIFTVNVTVLPNPQISATASPSNICPGQATFLSASGGSNYVWYNLYISGNNFTDGPTASVVYTVVNTEPNGCTSFALVNVVVNPLPTITAVASPSTVCLTSPNSVLTAGGGTSYVWNTGAITNPITVSPENTTIYSVIGTNADGCSNSANVTVTYVTCNVCTSCIPLGTSGLITSNPTANNVYCINNDVTISGTRIIVNCDFKMADRVKIIVPNGANLIISHSHFYACADMWQGIEVQNGGKLSILNNSLIEDAITAVDVTNNTQASGTVFNLNSSTFNRNYKSVYINNYNQAITNYPFIIKGCVFTSRAIPYSILNWPNTSAISATAPNAGAPLSSNIIDNANYSQTTNAFLKAPYTTQKSEMGIHLVNVGLTQGTEVSPVFYEFTLGANGNNNTNIFDNIRYEVNLFNANLNSINNVYQNTNFINRGNGGIGINAICDQYFNARLKVTKVNTSINKFIDCGTAINTRDYFVHEITDNEIRSSKVINAPLAPLNFNGMYGVNIHTNRYYNCTVNSNSIYNVENGIVFNSTTGTPFNIYGTSDIGQYAKELNIKNNIISANFIGSAITTQYTKNAIVLQNILFNGFNVRAPNLITVSNNQIEKVYRGISISNFGKMFQKINNNNVTLVQDVFGTNITEYGISFKNNWAYQSHLSNTTVNNTITGYGITNPNNSGILFEASTGITLGCNTVDNTYNGLHFNGFCVDAIYKNSMQNNNYGFVLNNNGIAGVGYNTTFDSYFAIGKPNEPADNLWNGTWSGGRFKTFAIFSDALNSPMFVRNTTGQYNPNGSSISDPPDPTKEFSFANGSLLYTTGATPTVCTFPLTAIVQNQGNGQLEKIVQNQVPVTGDVVQTRRVQKDQVYRMLKEDPSLMDNSTVLQNFHDANFTTNNEAFYSIERHLAKNELTQASAELSMVTVHDAVDVAYKTFNQSALHYQQGVFNAADSTALYQLSSKCPYTDGLVIFKARALYNVALNVVETFNNNCSVASSARLGNTLNEIEQDAIYKVELYPNPSNGNITIITDNETDVLQISIKDVTGKEVYSNNLNVNNYKTSFNIDVKNGIYFVEILNSNSPSKTVKKLVIQK